MGQYRSVNYGKTLPVIFTAQLSLAASMGGGTIFELQRPNGHYKEKVLYSFCPDGATNCTPQGSVPEAGLIPDAAGNYLYGTASSGGGGDCTGSSSGCGVVFKIALDGSDQYTMLYAFKGGADGALPQAPLVFDPTGNLYGTTEKGGGGNNCHLPKIGCGTVFMLANGKETKLHTFGRFRSRRDGAQPQGALLLQNGYLYGATLVEGDRKGCHCGTLFAINIGGKSPRGSSQAHHGLPSLWVHRPDQGRSSPAPQDSSLRH